MEYALIDKRSKSITLDVRNAFAHLSANNSDCLPAVPWRLAFDKPAGIVISVPGNR